MGSNKILFAISRVFYFIIAPDYVCVCARVCVGACMCAYILYVCMYLLKYSFKETCFAQDSNQGSLHSESDAIVQAYGVAICVTISKTLPCN